MKFVNPKNDVAFKKIFGNEDKKEILISFLNAVLERTGEKAIQEVELLNPYQPPKIALFKATTLDIKARDKRGATFIVEMQLENVEGALKRFAYYVTKMYSSQMQRGQDYTPLTPVIFVGILDFKMFAGQDYLTHHQILNSKTHEQELKDLEWNFIELPKFKKKLGELSSVLEKWVYFIKHAEELEVIPEHADFEELREAYEEANQFNWQPDELEYYENMGIKQQDERGAIALALREGMEKGMEKGLKQKALDTARKMLAKGYNLAELVELTGLSPDDLT